MEDWPKPWILSRTLSADSDVLLKLLYGHNGASCGNERTGVRPECIQLDMGEVQEEFSRVG